MHAVLDERLLILVRHSAVTINPATPAHKWHLSPEGQQHAHILAQQIATYSPTAVISSHETKAQETAAIIASTLGLSQHTADDLHEHVRHSFIADLAEWEATVANFFTHPDQLVLGTETAHQAQARFDAAVQNTIRQYSQGNLVIVTHGTVLTLFLAQHNPTVDPFLTWKSLTLPCFFVLTIPTTRPGDF